MEFYYIIFEYNTQGMQFPNGPLTLIHDLYWRKEKGKREWENKFRYLQALGLWRKTNQESEQGCSITQTPFAKKERKHLKERKCEWKKKVGF